MVDNRKKCIIVMGPSCTGKSYFINEKFNGLPCADLKAEQIKLGPNTYENVVKSYDNVLIDAIEKLKENDVVVLEHTLLKQMRRPMYIDGLRNAFENIYIEIYCLIPTREQFVMNYLKYQEAEKKGMKASVTNCANADYHEVMQVLEKPVIEEGFDKVHYISARNYEFKEVRCYEK